MPTAVIAVSSSLEDNDYSKEISTCHNLVQNCFDGEIKTKILSIESGYFEGPDSDYENVEEFKSELQDGHIDALVVTSLLTISTLGMKPPFGSTETVLHDCFENRTRIISPRIELFFHDRSDEFANLEQTITKKLVDMMTFSSYEQSRKIRQGMEQAKENSKWTGRPPSGFTVNSQHRLRVDDEKFRQIHQALVEIESGESVYSAATGRDVSRSTLQSIATDSERQAIYLQGSDAEGIDSRIESALTVYEHSHDPPYADYSDS